MVAFQGNVEKPEYNSSDLQLLKKDPLGCQIKTNVTVKSCILLNIHYKIDRED